jgi:hypothetical protein
VRKEAVRDPERINTPVYQTHEKKSI